MSRTYSPFDPTSAPTTVAGKPWRAILHTAAGWVHVGDYATTRGAEQATRGAIAALGYLALADRAGGTDRTYAIRWDMVAGHDDAGGRYHRSRFTLQGCAPR